ncbi:hypothetical protein Hte_012542 [Hypoxylon texense]
MGHEASAGPNAANHESQEVADNTRAERSPYSGKPVLISFRDGPGLWVPSVFIDNYPNLRAGSAIDHQYRSTSLDLCGHSGHVLVHYLFTGTYQCLEIREPTPYTRKITEFVVCTEIYAFAEEYKLPALKELTKSEIERVGCGLGLETILKLMKEKDLSTRPWTVDVWFYNYLKSRISHVLDGFSKPKGIDASEVCEQPYFGVITRILGDLYLEKIYSKSSSSSSDTQGQSNLALTEKAMRQAKSEVDDDSRMNKKRKKT